MTAPGTVPLPDDRSLDEALACFDRHLAIRQRRERVPGVQAAVHARGAVRMSVAHGFADVERDIPLTTRHLFRIASHSKTFTATAVLQLVEAGALRLDDRADHWIGYLSGTGVGSVTVRDLLSHTAGLFRDSRDGDFWQLEGRFPDRDALRDILTDPAANVLSANERFKYSNIGYGLLGLIVEAVTGARFNDHVRAAVIDRLGLTDVGPEFDPARTADYAVGYSSLDYASHRVPIEHMDTAALSAATGFYATAADLVRYFAAHVRGDETLLSDASKRLMQHAWWPVGSAERRYGLGLSVEEVGGRPLIGHGGGYPGHITNSVVDPTAGLAVSVLTNAIDGPASALAQAGVKLIDLAAAKPRPADDSDAGRFAGQFASLWGVLDVAVLGGRLYRLNITHADPVEDAAELEIVDSETLRVAGGSGYGSFGERFEYTFAADGSVLSVRADSGMTHRPLAGYSLPDRVIVRD